MKCPAASLGSSTKTLNEEAIYTGDQVITKGDFDQIPVYRLRPFRLTDYAFSLGDAIRFEALVGSDADPIGHGSLSGFMTRTPPVILLAVGSRDHTGQKKIMICRLTAR